jgi:hypothetical protein
MTAKLFEHLRATRQRMRQQLHRLQSGELQVMDVTRDPPVDVTPISIQRVQELLDDADQLIKIYGADQD